MLPSVSHPQKEKLVRSEFKKQDETKTLVILHNNKKYTERWENWQENLATKTEKILGFWITKSTAIPH